MRTVPVVTAALLVIVAAGAAFAKPPRPSDPPRHGSHAALLIAPLSGVSVSPAAGANASGYVLVRLNPDRRRVCFDIKVSGLDLPAAAARIHRGGAGENGPIVAALSPPGDDGRAKDCAKARRAVLKHISAHPHRYYVEVTTAQHPHGAARGQLRRAGNGKLPLGKLGQTTGGSIRGPR